MTDRFEGEGSFDRVVGMFARGWPVILVSTVASIVFASIFLHVTHYRYVVSYEVTSPQGSNEGGLNSKFGGLAAVAGVSLPGSLGETQFQLYQEGLSSREVATVLASDASLVRGAFPEQWSAEQGWHQPPDGARWLKQPIKNILGIPTYPWHRPGAEAMEDYLRKNLTIDQTPKNPVVTIAIEHRDPAFALKFLTALDRTTDQILRRRAFARATDYIAYLERKLATVTNAEQRMSIAQTLSEQERNRMMASSTMPFAAEVFSRPSSTANPTKPDPKVVLLISAFIGIFAGALIVLGIDGIRRRRRATALESRY